MIKEALALLECVCVAVNLRIPTNANLVLSIIADPADDKIKRTNEPLSLRERLKGPFGAHSSCLMDMSEPCNDCAIDGNEDAN